MIQIGTIVSIQDNSGGKTAKCLAVKNKEFGSVGDIIAIAIQSALPKYSVKKGEVHKALIVQTKKNTQRPDGSSIRNFKNSVVLLDSKKGPIGSRMLGAFNLEIRDANADVFKNASFSV